VHTLLDVYLCAHPYAHNPYAHPYTHPCAHPLRMKFGGMHTTPFTHKQIVGENQVMMIGVKKPKKTLKNHYHFVVVLGPDKDNRLGKKTFVTFELKHQKMKMTNE